MYFLYLFIHMQREWIPSPSRGSLFLRTFSESLCRMCSGTFLKDTAGMESSGSRLFEYVQGHCCTVPCGQQWKESDPCFLLSLNMLLIGACYWRGDCQKLCSQIVVENRRLGRPWRSEDAFHSAPVNLTF